MCVFHLPKLPMSFARIARTCKRGVDSNHASTRNFWPRRCGRCVLDDIRTVAREDTAAGDAPEPAASRPCSNHFLRLSPAPRWYYCAWHLDNPSDPASTFGNSNHKPFSRRVTHQKREQVFFSDIARSGTRSPAMRKTIRHAFLCSRD